MNKTFQTAYTTTKEFEQMLKEISPQVGGLSKSATIRYCVQQVHKLLFPEALSDIENLKTKSRKGA